MATMLAYPRTGILLNPSPSAPSSPLPFPTGAAMEPYVAYNTGAWPARSPRPHQPSLPVSSASTSSSAASSPHASPRTSLRKIRFAPLPDPRRSVLVTDDGVELPLPFPDDENALASVPAAPPAAADASPSTPTSAKRLRDADSGEWAAISSPTAIVDGSPDSLATPQALPGAPKPQSPYPATTALPSGGGYVDYTPAPAPSSGMLGKTKRLFGLGKSDKALTQSQSLDDLPRGGALGLFRAESRDSVASFSSLASFGTPISRTQSSASAKHAPPRRAATTSAAAGARGVVPARGKLMLNGRVYGSKRALAQQNLFETAKTEEQEFVEWGYGGMGAVKSKSDASGGIDYSALQGNARVAVGHREAHHGDADEDDGSGMAWLKRRREERERAKAEAAAAAAAAPATADADATPDATPQPAAAADTAPAGAPQPADSDGAAVSTAPEPLGVPVKQLPTPDATPMATPAAGPADASEYLHLPIAMPAHPDEAGARTPPSDGSGPPTPRDADDGGGGEDDEDAEEEARAQEARKTSIGASVEIVSRHKEH